MRVLRSKQQYEKKQVDDYTPKEADSSDSDDDDNNNSDEDISDVEEIEEGGSGMKYSC